ncbi:hypothetical protein [Bradyrhizobium sp. LHD-71]|uniref:hypothetical protein n=1 Tax=Bradyrhizobium sp. LHD-71 TaxID=3072141 RepID=UPI00280CF2B3|nr:hypothetical protein [Bradyrhizobium sp. LHD-71]MDQ8729951.1 hypothetical protein [Bradyrhizobium sp. LHD-71]
MSDRSEDFRQSVRAVALARAERDRETGISPPDAMLPRQRHWQELHRLSRKFDMETRQLIEQVVAAANIELGPHGFRIQPTRIMRRLPGEVNGAAWLIASETGIEPSGTLTFKLRDTGRLCIEAEGLPLAIRFDGADRKELEMPLDELTRAHVEAAFLSFIREVLGGAQHAFADD